MTPRERRLAEAREYFDRAFTEYARASPSAEAGDEEQLEEIARLLTRAGERLARMADRRRVPWRRPIR